LVIPKGKYSSFTEFGRDAAAEEKLDFIETISEIIGQYGLAGDGYRIVANTGAHGGQSVPHFHMHLIGGAMLDDFGL
jgi:diadenosine tetraphosphate (Ap4A) HIT family hydrolase